MADDYLKEALKTANQIISKCEGRGKWEDPDFPCSAKSIYRKKSPSAQITGWKRPDEITDNPKLFVDGVESGDVIQGSLGDCYFLGAISVLATRRDLLLPLFVTARPSLGFYQVKLFKNGAWVVITIDDRLPVNSQGNLVFAHCKDKNEMWVPIIEKAYAKLHGYYEAIESGSISAALMDLTGEASQSYDFETGDGSDLVRSHKLWDLLLNFEKEKYLMGCSCKKGGIETDTGKGILGNHAYSILQCVQISTKEKLLRIRNPWGCKEWKGRWADGSKEWTAALKKKLDFEFGDDGTFFMCYEDFVDQFDHLFVCRLLTDQVGHIFQHLAFEHEWNKGTAGGCSNHETWRQNDQWAITVSKKTEVMICVSQPDQRMLIGKEDYKASIGFNVFKTDNSRKLNTADPSKVIEKMNYISARHVASYFPLETGEYVLVPTTFEKGQTMSYYLHVFSYHPVQCSLIGDGPGRASAVASGKWSGKTAGGCFNHQTWVNNPKYLMKFGGKSSGSYEVEFILIQGSKSTCFIGLYIFGGYQDGQGLSTNQCVKQVQCINKNEISVSVQMPASGGQYVVMPITFKAGETNDFQLLINTEEKLTLHELEGTAQSMRSAGKVPEHNSKSNAKQPAGYSLIIASGGAGSKPLSLTKDISGNSSPSSKSKSSSSTTTTTTTTTNLKPSSPKPYSAPKSSPKPYTSPKSSSTTTTTFTTTLKPSTPKPYTAPKSPKGGTSSKSKSHAHPKGSTTTLDITKDRKGDIILSFGSGSGSKTKGNVLESFYCGGCGASQKKGAKQCTSCGVKLKK